MSVGTASVVYRPVPPRTEENASEKCEHFVTGATVLLLTLKNRSEFAATVLLGVDDRPTVPQELLRKARGGGSGRGIPVMFEPKRFVVLDLSVTHFNSVVP